MRLDREKKAFKALLKHFSSFKIRSFKEVFKEAKLDFGSLDGGGVSRRAYSAAWKTASSLPKRNEEIDIFFVNHRFDPPVSGILHNVVLSEGRAQAANDDCVPAKYVIYWKQT